MKRKSLKLRLQSSRDALEECLAELREAVETLDRLELEGEEPPVRAADVDRAYSLCLTAHRTLDKLVGKFR
ncbi:MAG: hypothetical protein HY319_20955 [Armatimonadetes bacterium]|nr:hypothetical protein [Armatimonadota bacterium]